MRIPILLLVLAAVARADAVEDYRKAQRPLDRRERAYWKEFHGRFLREAEASRHEVLYAYHNLQSDVIDPVNDETRKLYLELEVIADERGKAALALARSGDARAAALLFKELLRVAAENDKLDQELLLSKKLASGHMADQAPAFARHANARLQAKLMAAFTASPGASGYLLGSGWTRAVAMDRKSVTRRVMVIDLLASDGGGVARPFLAPLLRAKETPLRVAALEALVDDVELLASLLADANSIVRRALLQAVRARGGPRWIAPVLERYVAAEAIDRDLALAALGALTAQKFGDDPEAWRAWFERNRVEIDAGVFDPKKAKVDKPGAGTTAGVPVFYGVPTRSRALLFLCEWGHTVTYPFDVEFMRTRNGVDWFGMDMKKMPDWEKAHPSRRRVFRREVGRILDALPEDSTVAFVLLNDGSKNGYPRVYRNAILDAAPAKAPKTRRRIEKLLDTPPGWSRWQAQYDGLLIAMLLAGVDPAEPAALASPGIDTVFLVDNGFMRGRRYILPEMAVAAFARRNRFRRLVVHTIRVGAEGREAERLMKGLAEVSGGTYAYFSRTPP